ncbi:MAG: hypoxanthine phosphoribosyltransferase [Myxococcales bacterium]|nr:hypoxanthine phosphoribosyltransferase [Myxococcales bacterium]
MQPPSHTDGRRHLWATAARGSDEEHVVPMYDEEAIAERIAEIGARVDAAYRDIEELTVLAVMVGALPFCADLVRRIERPVQLVLVEASSYGDGTESSGEVEFDLERARHKLVDRHVLVLEDIVDSGRTLVALTAALREIGVASVRSAVLMDKKARRVVSFEPDFVGFEIPDAFVVGYGIDYAGRYRNLPFIGEVKNPSRGG